MQRGEAKIRKGRTKRDRIFFVCFSAKVVDYPHSWISLIVQQQDKSKQIGAVHCFW